MKRVDNLIYVAILSMLLFISPVVSGQVTIGNGEPPHPSAVLDLKTTENNKGFLGPRVSLIQADRGDPIVNPARGLLVYNLSDSPAGVEEENRVEADRFYYWAGNKWLAFVGEKIIETVIKESLDNLGIPRSAIFILNQNDPSVTQVMTNPVQFGIRNIFGGINTGEVVHLPLAEKVNNIGPDLVLWGRNYLTFKPGTYSITVSYGFEPTTPNSILSTCTISSYFIDFPIDYNVTGDRARIHSTAIHGTRTKAAHSGAIRYVMRIDSDYTWAVALGLGQSGNCQSTTTWIDPGGFSLMSSNTYVFVTRLTN